MEPSLFINHFAGGFRALVVALHDHRTAYQNFAVLRNSYFAMRNRQSGAAYAVTRKIAGHNRRSFGQAIALISGNANTPEKFRKGFREWRSAGRNDAQASASAF